MKHSIVNFQQYVSSTYWRCPEQLRGLIHNHEDFITSSYPLATRGNTFASARVALHNTENAIAITLSSFLGGGSVGLIPLAGQEPTLAAAPRTRWLDLAEDVRTTCVDWCDDLLFLGSSRGRILVADLDENKCTQSSGMLCPCGALLAHGMIESPVGDLTVSPSSHSATTLIRSVCVNVKINKSSLLAACGAEAFVWDLNGGPGPVRSWRPHMDATEEQASVVMFVRWAPGSDRVVLSGNYDGQLVLADTRCANASNALVFCLREQYVAACAEFNAITPSVFAAASSDGTFSIFDIRYHACPVQVIPSLQGDIAALKWLKLQSDMLLTAGTDGSVSMWNLRYPPTYAVGRAQYQYPLSDLVTTETFVEQRGIGISMGGELTITGLRSEAMRALAPLLGAEKPESSATAVTAHADVTLDFERLEKLNRDERLACGYLYTRRLKECYHLLSECANERFTLKDSSRSMQLVSLIDVISDPAMDYDQFMEIKCTGDSHSEGLGLEGARLAFELQLNRTASWLCTTVPLDRIRELSRPNPQDMRKLEALRLNTLLHQALDTKDPERVVQGMQQTLKLLTVHHESFNLIDVDVVCDTVAFLLHKKFDEGERYVKFLLSFLEESMTLDAASRLLRRVLTTVQEPLVTSNLSSRRARRFEERFLRNTKAAKEAVLTQLEIQRLGVEHYREVISAVNVYQTNCVAQKLPGMFGWLGVKPLILFLHCLTADSNYVTFFWVSIQYIEAFAAFPVVHQIEAVLFAVVDRIHLAAQRIVADLVKLATAERFSIPLLRQTNFSLHTAHGFLVVLLRVQLECENVALSNHMEKLPPVMEKILGMLSTVSEDVLNAWSDVIEALLDHAQVELIRKYCLITVQDFSLSIDALMDVSAKENDERLEEILDLCDDFLDVVCENF